MKPVAAWIALSGQDGVAWFLGVHRTKVDLMLHYSKRFGHSLTSAGYKAKKVKLVPADRTIQRREG